MDVELVALDTLVPFPGNPRRGDVDRIARSIERNGVYKPIVVQRSTRTILAGNHTWQAAQRLGMEAVHVVWSDADDDTARRIMLVDNATNDAATYDWAELDALLADLSDLDGTGYNDDDLALIAERAAASLNDLTDPDDDRAPTTGELLELAHVTVAEPTHKTHHGQRWTLGKHTLVIAKVADEHHLWRHLLTDEMRFAPYPEPYYTCSDVARDTALLLVQPNTYLAGHLLDKHAAAFGEDTVTLCPE